MSTVSPPVSKRKQSKAEKETHNAESSLTLKGVIERNQYPELEKGINELFSIAVKRDNDSEFLRSKNSHFNKLLSRTFAGVKDIAELATEYKGFEQSSEAGDIILGEKLKIKSKASSEYAKQIKRDRIETDVVQTLMLISEALGNSSSKEKDELMGQAKNLLIALVGNDEAQKALQLMRDWNASIVLDTQICNRKPWNSLETAQQIKAILAKAIDGDEVVSNIRYIVHKKYNRRSAMARACAKILNATLSLGGCTPCIIGTASQCAWTLYIATQGGPEEAKLLKEVYLAKELESRCKSLADYINLAVNSHNMAIASQNSAMLCFSDWLMSRYYESKNPEKLDSSNICVQDPEELLTVIDSASIDCKSSTEVAEAISK